MKDWSIGIYHGNSLLDFAPLAGVINPVLTASSVTDMKALFVADPFMIQHAGRWYLFFEAWNAQRDMGEICLATSTDAKLWTYDRRVLWEEHHLSYPFVFEWNGAWYMLPESRAIQSVQLYQATNFPHEWTRVATLVEGDFADPTLLRFQGRWWLFVLQGKENLALFYSDELTHGWQSHPGNPVVRQEPGRARPAGRIRMDDGERLIRYTQDNRVLYGQQVRAFEIQTLSTSTYTEVEATRLPVLSPAQEGWNGVAMHHLDAHSLAEGGWVACVDGAESKRTAAKVDHLFAEWKQTLAFTPQTLPTLLFYCQHLVGLGHFTRSLALSRALSSRFHVILLSGGEPPPEFEPPAELCFIQLPPLASHIHREADNVSMGLMSRDDTLSVEEVLALRQAMLAELWDRLQPRVLIIEHFPFGRRNLEPELFPLLERAKKAPDPKPLVFSSIRDILGQGMDYSWSRVMANRLFDGILVHSDPDFTLPREELDEELLPLKVPLIQTGFVVSQPTPEAHDGPRDGPIVVSAGGGRNGAALYSMAVAVQKGWAAAQGLRMRIVCGPFLPEEEWQTLTRQAEGIPGLVIDRWVPDMLPVLSQATMAIAFFGYNTALDLMRSGTPALVVPYVEPLDSEQWERAQKWAERGAVRVLHPGNLTYANLVAEIEQTLTFKPRTPQLDLNGAANTTALISRFLSSASP